MRVAVLGAGNGGHAMAADLALRGHEVSLYSSDPEKVRALVANDGIDITGVAGSGHARLRYAGHDVAQAVDGAHVVVLTVPGMVQERYMELVLPHVLSTQLLWLCPGNAGSLLVRKRLQGMAAHALLVVESMTLPYGARLTGPASVAVRARYRTRYAALPAARTEEAMAKLQALFECEPATNVLETALMNVNALVHPLPSLMNWGWIEQRKRAFSLYGEGMTPGVLRCLRASDAERVSVCRAVGVRATPLDDIYEDLGSPPNYRLAMGMGAAERYEDRFIIEDVSIGLVLISSMGARLGVPTPLIDGVIALAGALYERDFRAEGRSLERLGLEGADASDLMRAVTEDLPR